VTINREEALERVRSILVEQLGVDEEQVTEDASFQGDLDAQKIATVGEAVDYVTTHS
jgi:acyl carrier protein